MTRVPEAGYFELESDFAGNGWRWLFVPGRATPLAGPVVSGWYASESAARAAIDLFRLAVWSVGLRDISSGK